jgi:hypothetical protein
MPNITTQKGLGRNALKYIAIFFMIVDHLGFFIFYKTSPTLYYVCRVLGKICIPIMCLFIAEGYKNTSNKGRYILRMFLFAIVTQFPFAFACHGTLLVFKFNVLFNFCLTLLALLCHEKINNKFLKILCIIPLLWLTYYCDWRLFVPFMVFIFTKFTSKKSLAIAYPISCLIYVAIRMLITLTNNTFVGTTKYYELTFLGLLLALPFILLYNGNPGRKNAFNKWFFYFFYPVQFLIFYCIKIFLL